jgi:L-iditol 2-dehydrogenase
LRAALYYNNKDIRVEELPVPPLKSGELLLKVEASGVCGSDVMEWYRVKKAPLVLGHEIAGTVEKTADGVERFKSGDRVTVSHHVPCNTCRFCLSGNHTVCDTLRSTNFDPGGFSEYVRVPAINVDRGVFPIPTHVSFEEATFTEPLGCVARGFRLARFSPGERVLVIGAGISGLLHVKLARALGAGPVAAVDVDEYRIEMAGRFGADLALNAKEDVAKKLKDCFGLADTVFLCTARDSAIKQALECAERGGTVVFFAPKEPDAAYPMPMFKIWRDGITLVNTYGSAPADSEVALSLICSGRVGVKDMITHRLSLDDTGVGFALTAQARNSLKVVIEPHKRGVR